MNWLAIVGVVIVNQALGFVWYSQLFGKIWMESVGRTPGNVHSTAAFVVSIISGFLMAIALSCLIRNQNADSAFKGAKVGMMVWLGFVGPVLAMHYLFLGHNWTTIAIDAFEQLAALNIMGAILAVWRKK